jgi:hypothetical protein
MQSGAELPVEFLFCIENSSAVADKNFRGLKKIFT